MYLVIQCIILTVAITPPKSITTNSYDDRKCGRNNVKIAEQGWNSLCRVITRYWKCHRFWVDCSPLLWGGFLSNSHELAWNGKLYLMTNYSPSLSISSLTQHGSLVSQSMPILGVRNRRCNQKLTPNTRAQQIPANSLPVQTCEETGSHV
jgi:hypothetical protein